MKAIITVGISASGKTSWAVQFVKDMFAKGEWWKIVCRDDIRRMLLEQKLNRELVPGELWKKWNFKDESKVNVAIDGIMKECQERGYNIIVADTNLNKDRNRAMKDKLEKMGYDVEFKEFEISFEEAAKRDAGRCDGVGVGVLWRQFKQWYELKGYYKYSPDYSKPQAVIFDIDGTLARMRNRGPFEWDKVDTDDVRYEIKAMLDGFRANYNIIIMSGRDGVSKDKTVKWLTTHGIKYDMLLMRAVDDGRKDSVIKEELFRNHVADKFHVILAVDDRPQMSRTWELMNVPVAAVANQYEEF